MLLGCTCWDPSVAGLWPELREVEDVTPPMTGAALLAETRSGSKPWPGLRERGRAGLPRGRCSPGLLTELWERFQLSG